MKKLILIIVAITVMIMPGMVSGQNQINRPSKKKTEQAGSNKPNKQSPTKHKIKARQLTISEPDGYVNGYGYVDLGLPSGTKWATCNVGASSPSDSGNLYAWGETSPKSAYTLDNSLYKSKSTTYLEDNGIINSARNLTKSYDAAYKNWGENWRMPTEEELYELKEKCKWTWGIYSGKEGAKVTGPNNHSIFMPAVLIGSLRDVYGKYWSSSYGGSPDEDWFYGAYIGFWDIEKEIRISFGGSQMYGGYSIRPVTNDVRIKPIGNFGK